MDLYIEFLEEREPLDARWIDSEYVEWLEKKVAELQKEQKQNYINVGRIVKGQPSGGGTI